VLSAPADCPFLPRDLLARLHQARIEQNAQVTVAASGGQTHHVVALWSVALREELRHALVAENIRKVELWAARYSVGTVTWPTAPLDPFFNANTADDLAEAERLAALDGG
jgi:molybdopterin-guanine dinucleotide biosynthesis protein A